MRWFLRSAWYGIRSWGVGIALGSLIADLTFTSDPPAWPTPALYKYAFFTVFCGTAMGLFLAWRASAQPGPAEEPPRG